MSVEEITAALRLAYERRAIVNREIMKLERELREASPEYRAIMDEIES